MIFGVVVCFAVGWIAGVHLPWYVGIPLGLLSLYFANKEEGLGGVALVIGGACPLLVGILLGGLVYGDIGVNWINLSWLLTGG